MRPIHSVKYAAALACSLVLVLFAVAAYAEEVAIDASDPTKIYSYAGGGIKYTDYTNGEGMWEARATGNLGLTQQDMVLFEFGYGYHSGDRVAGKSVDLTNARARWFHVFNMDYGVTTGYRGWATQADMQVAGSLKGTDGQNTLAIGALPAFGINENLSFFLPVSIVNTWDKKFQNYNGLGVSIAPLLSIVTDSLWPDAYFQIWPNYTRFIAGDLDGEGAGNIDLTAGGSLSEKVYWAITYQKSFDKDLNSYRRGRDTGLVSDQSLFLNLTTYF